VSGCGLLAPGSLLPWQIHDAEENRVRPRPPRVAHPGTLADARQMPEAFYGDVDPATTDAAIALAYPDAPVGTAVGAITLIPDGLELPGVTHTAPVAATALTEGLELAALNARHYPMFPELARPF
jgi:hypothetical protein